MVCKYIKQGCLLYYDEAHDCKHNPNNCGHKKAVDRGDVPLK